MTRGSHRDNQSDLQDKLCLTEPFSKENRSPEGFQFKFFPSSYQRETFPKRVYSTLKLVYHALFDSSIFTKRNHQEILSTPYFESQTRG